jgi:hypothetical protein
MRIRSTKEGEENGNTLVFEELNFLSRRLLLEPGGLRTSVVDPELSDLLDPDPDQ